MDRLAHGQNVLVLAATNRPDLLDPALLRPGRFDRLVHVPVPDEAARSAILTVQLRGMAVGSDVDVLHLAARTDGFTGADLQALCNAAAFAALDKSLQAECVAARHFEAALAQVAASPPVAAETAEWYARLRRTTM